RPIARLILGGRVPPRVEVDDGVGGGEVEAGAARLERDQEEGDRALLEGSDELAPLRCGRLAVQVEQLEAARAERLRRELEVRRELAEDERAVPLAREILAELERRLELAALHHARGIDEARVAREPAHAGERGEHLEALLRIGPGLFELLDGATPLGLVERGLLLRELDDAHDVGARRQLRRDLVLAAAQEKRTQQAAQRLLAAEIRV